MYIKYILFIFISFSIFNSSFSQKFEKISESSINNQIGLDNYNLSYKDGKVALISSVLTDASLFSIGYLKLTDTLGITYFEKYIKSVEDTLKMDASDVRITDNEVEILCRKTLNFTEGKFDSFYYSSRLNVLRYDFSGNETYNNLDTNDTTVTFWSLFYLTYNNYGKPICLYSPKTYGTININTQFNQYDSDGNVDKIKIVSKFEEGDTSIFSSSKYIVGKNDNYYANGTEYYKDESGKNIRVGIVFKINSDLEIEWKKRFENENLQVQIDFNNLVELNNGNILAFSSEGQFLLNSDGELLKRFEIKNNNENDITIRSRIVQNQDGDLLVSGLGYDKSNFKESSYIAKIDIEGNVKWEKTLESPNNSRIIDLIEYKENHYLFLEFQYGTNSLNLYKFGDVLTSVEDDIKSEQFSIFPNPVGDNINLSNLNQVPKYNSLSIIDINGRTVLEKSITNISNKLIDVSNLLSGPYFMILERNNGTEQQLKFIKR